MKSWVVCIKSKLRTNRGAPSSCAAHCGLLKYYCSVDFIWWFDRKISFFSLVIKNSLNDRIQNCILWFDKKTLLPSNFVSVQIFKLICRPNAWMDSLEINSIRSVFYSISCSLSLFYREWPQLSIILISFDVLFVKKFKSLTFYLKQAIHGENNLTSIK